MGLVAHEFKRKIRGDDSDESAVEKITGAVDRSGIMGYFTDVHNGIETLTDNQIGINPLFGEGKPYGSSSRWVAGTLFGPTGGKLVDAHTVLTGAMDGEFGIKQRNALDRMAVGQNLFYIQEGFWSLPLSDSQEMSASHKAHLDKRGF